MAAVNGERQTVNVPLLPKEGQKLKGQLSFLPCRHCPKSFAKKKEMNSHVDHAHLGRRLICEACGNILRDEIAFDKHREEIHGDALWSGTNKNRDVSTGPLARPFARSLAPLTRSLAPDCSLRSRPPLRSLICSHRSLDCLLRTTRFACTLC